MADLQTPAPVQEDTYTVPCTYNPDFHRFVLSCSIEQFERCQHDEEHPRSVSYHANLPSLRRHPAPPRLDSGP